MQAITRGTTPLAASIRRAILPASALLLAAAAFTPAQAQIEARPTISVHRGIFDYDLAGAGTVRHFAARAELPIASKVLVEGSLGYSRPGPRPEERVTVLTPEVQAQFQYPIGRIAPYVGIGGGTLMALPGDAQDKLETELAVSVAGGVRVQLVERLGARAELRVRGVEPKGEGAHFTGSTTELTAGLSWRL